MFEDIPTFWDAWDLEATHLEKAWEAGYPPPPPTPAPAPMRSSAYSAAPCRPAGVYPEVPKLAFPPHPVLPTVSGGVGGANSGSDGGGAMISVLESGPLRASIRVEFALSARGSRLVQVISLASVAPR